VIPVDAVAGNAWRIRSSGSDARIFHLTNASPPTVEEVTRAIFEGFGLEGPVFVRTDAELTPVERLLANNPRDRFQLAYVSADRRFDVSNTVAAIGSPATDYPLGADQLRAYVEWYVEHRLGGVLQATGAGRDVV
jgi:hypothetical protein